MSFLSGYKKMLILLGIVAGGFICSRFINQKMVSKRDSEADISSMANYNQGNYGQVPSSPEADSMKHHKEYDLSGTIMLLNISQAALMGLIVSSW